MPPDVFIDHQSKHNEQHVEVDSSELAVCHRKASHLLMFCYVAQVVAGAGAIDHTHLVDLAGKSFASLPTNPTTADDLVKKVSQGWEQIHALALACCNSSHGYSCSIGIVLRQKLWKNTLQATAAASTSFCVHLQDRSFIMYAALPASGTAYYVVSIFP